MSRDRLALIDVGVASMVARTYFRVRRRMGESSPGFATVRTVWREHLAELLATPATTRAPALRGCTAVRLYLDHDDESPCA
jgi:hypothetical protein